MTQDIGRFYQDLRTRLRGKNYHELQPTAPMKLAFLKSGSGLSDPRVIAVVDGRTTTDSPGQIFERLKNWFETAPGGRRGEGFLLFVYFDPPASAVDEITGSHFYAGNIAVAAGAYDLLHGKHWLSYSAWEADVFGG